MKLNKFFVAMCVVTSLSGCATAYQEMDATSFTGGYTVNKLDEDIYRVLFSANGYSTRETAQTYWLYKCADLALEKGAKGFEILSHINLVQTFTVEEFFEPKSLVQKSNYVYIPVYTDDINKPYIEADIQLIYDDFEPLPPKVFDAEKLKSALEHLVTGEKCEMGNVCKHVHKYIHPEGKFDKPI